MTPPPIIFVRHGETDWNVANRLQGQTDIPLNARGRDQADAVGRTLAAISGVGDRAFVASPLSRATETMRRLRAAMGLDPDTFATDERLKELTFGRWEGLTFADIGAREPGAIKARDADRWGHTPPGGESYEDVSRRVSAVLRELTGPTVIVSHGGVARAVLALIGGADKATLPKLHIQQGRSIALEDGGWRWM